VAQGPYVVGFRVLLQKPKEEYENVGTVLMDVKPYHLMSVADLWTMTHKTRNISFSPHLHENHVKSLHWQAFGLGVKGVAAATQKEKSRKDRIRETIGLEVFLLKWY
jgi:hypothetical protein